MSIYKLTEESISIAKSLHESGMGYQIIKSGEYDEYYWILNSFLALDLEDVFNTETLLEYRDLLWGDPDDRKFQEIYHKELSSNSQIAFSDFESILDTRLEQFSVKCSTNVSPFILPPTAPPQPYAYFRYSAFARDNRVDPTNGNYRSGTYATTYNDIHQVPSGFAAVGRYALPNPLSAKYVFPIVTNDRPTYMGTATPNFGQAGGGVEVFFRDGANNIPGSSFIINTG